MGFLWRQTRRVRVRRAVALLANLSRRRYAIIAMPTQMSNAGSTMITMPLSMAWTDPGIMVIVVGNLGQRVGADRSLVQRSETVGIRPELIHHDEHEDQGRYQAPEECPALIPQMHEIHHP